MKSKFLSILMFTVALNCTLQAMEQDNGFEAYQKATDGQETQDVMKQFEQVPPT